MPRGGAREGAGRKARPTSKAKCIWLGQITDEQRDFIIQWLSPDERFGALWAAANKACSRTGCQRAPCKVKIRSGNPPLTQTVGRLSLNEKVSSKCI